MRSPSLPNRTGGSPASGFPVSGCSSEEEHAFRAVPKDARQTFGSTQANCTRLVPPPVSPRGHSRWFVFRHSVLHPSTFLRSLRPMVGTSQRDVPASQGRGGWALLEGNERWLPL